MLAPEGRKIILGLMLVTFVCGVPGFIYDQMPLKICSIIFALLFIFSINFFRDPLRQTPEGKNLLIAPADGKVIAIKDVLDNEVGNARQISIFLNIFNVHSNKIPINACVKNVHYKPGAFKAAFKHSTSDVNEQVSVLLESDQYLLKVKQIAGLIARRIKCYAQIGEIYNAGERYGFIMFGSRTDLIVPANSEVNITVGDKVKGGMTVIGNLK